MNNYAVALYLERETEHGKQTRLYQSLIKATDEYQALGLAYRESKVKLPNFNLVLEIVTKITEKGGDDEG